MVYRIVGQGKAIHQKRILALPGQGPAHIGIVELGIFRCQQQNAPPKTSNSNKNNTTFKKYMCHFSIFVYLFVINKQMCVGVRELGYGWRDFDIIGVG